MSAVRGKRWGYQGPVAGSMYIVGGQFRNPTLQSWPRLDRLVAPGRKKGKADWWRLMLLRAIQDSVS